ncbi:Fur family transcriptional regulator [Deferribacter thermophilus]|uniref:Fur family transcriptional regulator n=1 Tax=Deferribacter thermophilus TaxID=53573 RepID=UPI003C1CA0B8
MFKEKAIEALKNAGFKLTKPRMWIVEYLDGNKNHPSAVEIYDDLRKDKKYFSFATVYNTLDTLVKAGAIKQITVDPTCSRFDPDISEHGHFVCKICNKVYDLENIQIDFEKDYIAEIEHIDLHIKGVCKNCKKQ